MMDEKVRQVMVTLQIIAVEVSNSRHGDFLKAMARAWQFADKQNKHLLMPVWNTVAANFQLVAEYAEEINEHREEYKDWIPL